MSQFAELLLLLQQILHVCPSCGFDLHPLLRQFSSTGLGDFVASANKKKKTKKAQSDPSLACRNDGHPNNDGSQTGKSKGKSKGKRKDQSVRRTNFDTGPRSFSEGAKSTPAVGVQPAWQLRSSADLMTAEDVAGKTERREVKSCGTRQ